MRNLNQSVTIDRGTGSWGMLLLENPHLSQTTPHLSLRVGWGYHTAQSGSDLPKTMLIHRKEMGTDS